ncbi:MAG: methionine--tRNA ligase [bacterium]|nr:methionine--tRNA ligase [bacterium]
MSDKKTFYITTPIYYVNDKPHIGHAYTSITGDVLARYHRMKGDQVFFLMGVDENSQKNVEAFEKSGCETLEQYLGIQAAIWQQAWDSINITNDGFIRTTEERHKIGVYKFFDLVNKKGDIYKGLYKGYYCNGCEEFIKQSDLLDGEICAMHKKKVETIEEENYFFSASKYKDALLAHIEKNPDFIQPISRRNEVVNYIKDHFGDVSISRHFQVAKCGIPLPIDPDHAIYVWFDALINYLTGIGYGTDDEAFDVLWPASMHIVGKDILKFHCALWPAMLMSAGLPLPEKVFAHGFFTIDGDRIGKSLGNAIDPVELSRTYGVDTVRYFLMREIPFGEDGDFSFERLKERYESDLAKGLGNFASRVLTLAEKVDEKSLDDITGLDDEEAQQMIVNAWEQYAIGIEKVALDDVLKTVWECLRWGDKYIEQNKPWALAKEDPEHFAQTMVLLLEVLRHISAMVYPFLPETAEKLWKLLDIESLERSHSSAQLIKWIPGAVTKPTKGVPLFPPIEQP